MTLGRQFDPHRLAYGEEVTVDPSEMDHPSIRLNERDPRRGGRGLTVHDNVMDEVAPGHGLGDRLKYADLTQGEVRERRSASYDVTVRYRSEHGDDWGKDPALRAKYTAETEPFKTGSLDDDQYIEGIANSMKTVGQQEPGILFSEEGGGFWLGEGNHRLAAARRHGLPYKVKRRDKG